MATAVMQLREERARIWEQAKGLLERAEAEGRDLAGEELETWQRLLGKLDELRARIERVERLDAIERELSRPEQPVVGPQMGGPGEQRDGHPRGSAEYRSAFQTYVRLGLSGVGPTEVRALSVGTDSQGGYLVPTDFQRQLIQALAQENVMRQIAGTIRTSSSKTEIPVVVDQGVATWTGENAAFNESDTQYGTIALGAHKLARIIRVSEELLADAAFDIEAHLTEQFARSFGIAEEAAFVAGSGTGQPRGVLQDAQVGKTAASATAIAADELIDLYFSVREPYRRRGTWLVADSTMAAIRKLQDSTGQYLWQPGLAAGAPDTLLGRPVRTSPAMPAIATGAKVVAFGDFSFYRIADRDGIGLQRLVERYADVGQVGFRMWERVDGRLVLPEAVKVLQMA